MPYKVGDRIEYYYTNDSVRRGTINRVLTNRVYVKGNGMGVYPEDIIGVCEPVPIWAEIMAWITIVSLIYCSMGVGIGLINSATQREEGKDGCVYRSVMAYINPGYLASCEIARARFNIEQPVQYIAPDAKELGNQ